MKKYSLTDEHKKELKPWADKWIANGMNCKPMDEVDREAMRKAVKGLYEAAQLSPPKNIVFVPSPFVLRFAGGFASAIWWLRKNKSTRNAFRAASATDNATYAATDAATDAATYAATDAATYAATRAATDAATRAATDATDATDAATYAATRDATDAARNLTGDAVYATCAATDAAAADAARDATYDATRVATYAATDAATDAATYVATDAATRAATDATDATDAKKNGGIP